MHWFLDPIVHHYADFKGRASRKGYWMFILWYFLVLFGSVFGVGLLQIVFMGADAQAGSNIIIPLLFGVLFLGLLLGLLVPVIALHVRRLHDIGYSGWWYLLSFIPYLGGLIVLVLMCLPSQEGTNKYGPHPYAASEPLPPEPLPVPLPPPRASTVA
ncbi:DUF805 domain-containing protein [Patescibacteria group bacterium]|nr:DUF805 domain-containing protein [Patescibacteria group bacterium]